MVEAYAQHQAYLENNADLELVPLNISGDSSLHVSSVPLIMYTGVLTP